MKITDVTGNCDNDRTSQKKINSKWGLMRNSKNMSSTNDIQQQ